MQCLFQKSIQPTDYRITKIKINNYSKKADRPVQKCF